MIKPSEIAQEIKKIKRNNIRMSFFEYVLLFFTCLGLLINFVFSILVYFVFSQNELVSHVWIYFLIFTSLDALTVTFSILWFWNCYSNSSGNIPLPRSSNVLKKVTFIITVFNTSVSIFIAVISTFVIKSISDTKIYIFGFTLQTILIFAYWGWFISYTDTKIEKSYMKKIQYFADFTMNNVSKYETYIISRFDQWVDKYNKNLYDKNKYISVKTKILNFLKFDFRNDRWKKHIITNREITAKSLEYIFSDKNVTSYEEFCKYHFVMIARVYMLLYNENDNLNSSFTLFYWVRKKENIKDFEEKIMHYR